MNETTVARFQAKDVNGTNVATAGPVVFSHAHGTFGTVVSDGSGAFHATFTPSSGAAAAALSATIASAPVTTAMPTIRVDAAPVISSVSPASGITTGGTALSIILSTYSPSTPTVTVGGASATGVSYNASTGIISCTAPAGTAGARDVVVTDSHGQAATSTGGFTYITSVAAVRVVDFSTYADFAAVHADTTNFQASDESGISASTAKVSTDMGGTPITKSLIYTFNDRTADTGLNGSGKVIRCTDLTRTVFLKFPATYTEVWGEVLGLFPIGFTTKPSFFAGCPGVNADYKYFWGRVTGTAGSGAIALGALTFMVGTYGGQYTVGYPTLKNGTKWIGGSSTGIFSGVQHQIRFHWRIGASGTCAFNVNDTTIKDFGTVDMTDPVQGTTTGITGIKLGLNMNMGPDHDEYSSFQKVSVWNAYPVQWGYLS